MAVKSFGRNGLVSQPTANQQPKNENFSQRNKKFLNRISIALLCLAGLIFLIVALAKSHENERRTVSFDADLLQNPVEVRTAETSCAYTILSVGKIDDGTIRIINSQDCKKSGKWVTESLYNCSSGKRKITRDGESQSQLVARYNDGSWDSLTKGSSATVVGKYACKLAGQELQGIVG